MRLYIRATLPPKPGKSGNWKQQDIATGKPATLAGLKIALQIAREVDSKILRERFVWKDYVKADRFRNHDSVRLVLKRFEQNHWSKRQKTSQKLNSWHCDYELRFNHLPADEVLTLDLLKSVMLTRSKPESRNRKAYATAFSKLAKFAEIEGAEELMELGRGYSPTRINSRNLPDDSRIIEAIQKLPEPGWQWIYMLLAIYGLRPHEVLQANTDRLGEEIPLLEVPDETKTGHRLVFPMQGSLSFELLAAPCFPRIKYDRSNYLLGGAISNKFNVKKVGFRPYDLRHAYARRGYELGFPPEFLARSMGHSYDIHCRIYKAWMDESSDLKLYQAITANQKTVAHQAESQAPSETQPH